MTEASEEFKTAFDTGQVENMFQYLREKDVDNLRYGGCPLLRYAMHVFK